MMKLFILSLMVLLFTMDMAAQTTDETVISRQDDTEYLYPGKPYLDGIIFYLYMGEDGKQHGLIVSKTEFLAQYQIGPGKVNANSTWDGAYNTKLMIRSPSKDWITENFSSEWYLPSIDELNLLWQNRFHVNKTLTSINGQLLDPTQAYLSSTEALNKFSESFSFILGFDTGLIFTNYKSKDYYIRAIRAF